MNDDEGAMKSLSSLPEKLSTHLSIPAKCYDMHIFPEAHRSPVFHHFP